MARCVDRVPVLAAVSLLTACARPASEPSEPTEPTEPTASSAAPSPAATTTPEPQPASDVGTPRAETPAAGKRRAALRLLATCFDDTPACHEEVCAASFGPGEAVVVSTPAPGTISGMTEDGPVPLGPVLSVEIDASGAVRSYDLGEGAIPCEAAPAGSAP
jgi:hypothetical protein